MKKIFCCIGALIAVFSIFIIILVQYYDVSLSEQQEYHYTIDDNSPTISISQLEKIAIDADVQVQIKSYGSMNYGNRNINFRILNADENIQEGRQPSIFPGDNINYILNSDDADMQISYFIIQEDDNSKIDAFNSQLEDLGISYSIISSQPYQFNFFTLFVNASISIFLYLLLFLLLVCIISYYAYRVKEIGILKQNGWSNFKISLKIVSSVFLRIVLSSLVIMIPIAVYIAITNIALLNTYARLSITLIILLFAVFLISSIIAIVFIHKLNQITAIKNGRNNKPYFVLILGFKVIITLLVFTTFNSFYINLIDSNNAIKSGNEIKSKNLYTGQSFGVSESEINKLNDFADTLSDDEVFNYDSMSVEKSYTLMQINNDNLSLNEYSEMGYSYLRMSSNFIPYISDDITIDNEKLKYVLIPEHLEDETSDILIDWYGTDDLEELDITIQYIEDGIIYKDPISPDKYIYDAIVIVSPVQKEFTLPNSEVYFTQDSAAQLENYSYDVLELPKSELRLRPINDDIDLIIANKVITLSQSVLSLVVALISYILVVNSIIIIYFELKKKRIAVNLLLGRIPIKTVVPMVAVNTIIALLLAIFINPILISLVVLELIIYVFVISRYFKRAMVCLIKGE